MTAWTLPSDGAFSSHLFNLTLTLSPIISWLTEMSLRNVSQSSTMTMSWFRIKEFLQHAMSDMSLKTEGTFVDAVQKYHWLMEIFAIFVYFV